MTTSEGLLQRLDEIGQSIARSGHGLALIGLGSVGLATERLDAYSDLDFFVIVERGAKQRYIEQLDWLEAVAPLAYHYRNTVDGHKALFRDGIFCEFAVFEADELPRIPFAPGRIVWQRDDVDDAMATPANPPPVADAHDIDWHLGEALTNLYVGLSRYRRGEKLSAARFVQQYAVDQILALLDLETATTEDDRDGFAPERRIEARHPEIAVRLPTFVQGYARTPESAAAILDYLCGKYVVNGALAAEIRGLCGDVN